MKKLNYLMVFMLFMLLTFSCKNNDKDTTDEQKTDESEVIIDSSAFKIKTGETHDFKVMQDAEPSSPEDVKKLTELKNTSSFNDYQKFAQEFITACGNKNYAKAANYMSYMGKDQSRVFKDHFNYNNPAEQGIVKVTADVVFTFLSESSDYEFISATEKMDPKMGKIQVLEITFFKKGMGVNRRFFEVIDTPKGKLIYNMR